MSRKPSFANLRDRTAPVAQITPVASTEDKAPRPASREGRKQIAGFFTPDMSLAMHMMARRQGRSLQALMAEAFNDVLRKYGESPVGE
ncbi:MAG: ribbon-helix-helix domain-containing protein [Sphingomonas pseudosanguinis]|uniref:ribbon-helix-helix domain-containing protein n=1 Tax=Sphingomonas pseudosanguinis TaxID=413712 RepID=UPI00391C151D